MWRSSVARRMQVLAHDANTQVWTCAYHFRAYMYFCMSLAAYMDMCMALLRIHSLVHDAITHLWAGAWRYHACNWHVYKCRACTTCVYILPHVGARAWRYPVCMVVYMIATRIYECVHCASAYAWACTWHYHACMGFARADNWHAGACVCSSPHIHTHARIPPHVQSPLVVRHTYDPHSYITAYTIPSCMVYNKETKHNTQKKNKTK